MHWGLNHESFENSDYIIFLCGIERILKVELWDRLYRQTATTLQQHYTNTTATPQPYTNTTTTLQHQHNTTTTPQPHTNTTATLQQHYNNTTTPHQHYNNTTTTPQPHTNTTTSTQPYTNNYTYTALCQSGRLLPPDNTLLLEFCSAFCVHYVVCNINDGLWFTGSGHWPW